MGVRSVRRCLAGFSTIEGWRGRREVDRYLIEDRSDSMKNVSVSLLTGYTP